MTGTSTLVELLLARIEQDERIVDLSHRHPHARRYGRPPADRGRVAIHAGTLLSRDTMRGSPRSHRGRRHSVAPPRPPRRN